MGSEWVNIGTGQKSATNPGLINAPGDAVSGIYNNGMNANNWQQRWVPDPVVAPVRRSSSVNSHAPVQTPMGAAADRMFLKGIKFAGYALIFVGLPCALLALVGFIVVAKLEASHDPQAAVVGNTWTYKASDITSFYKLPWHNGDWIDLKGQNVVIVGDVHDASIRVQGNITIEGDTSTSGIMAHNGVITVGNVTSSRLTGYGVVIKGAETSTSQTVESEPISRGSRSAQKRRR